VTLEGIENKDRVDVLGSTRLERKMSSAGGNTITLTLTVQQDRKPLHPEFPKRIEAAQKIGMRALRGPARIGWVRADDPDGTFFEPDASEIELSNRLNKVNDMATAIAARGVGDAIAKELAQKFSARDDASELWFQALRRAKDVHERRQVERAVGEWADGDSVAAHYGYGIDLFCSQDLGKSASSASVLDANHRQWLTDDFGIRFATLAELAEMV
jgi:hypothetical protein